MYREMAPPPSLQPLVACFWTSRADAPLAGVHRHRVLPDNCSDFIFDLGDVDPGSARAQRSRSYWVGTMRTAMVVEHTGRIDMLGVRFRPGVAAAVMGIPAHELTDKIVALDAVARCVADIVDRLGEATVGGRGPIIAHAVSEWLGRTGRVPDARVGRAGARIGATGGRIRIDELAEEVGLSTRQLERAFRREVGISPKEAARVARLQRAAQFIGTCEVSLSTAALRAGYHDQSHMTREFRRLAGVTPARYATERGVGFVQDRDAVAT